MPANIEVDIIQSFSLKRMIKLLAYYILTETPSLGEKKKKIEGFLACLFSQILS